MKVFYHNDADGYCSAALVAGEYSKDDVEFVEMDYHKEFPLESIREGEDVWIVDFSVDPVTMEKVLIQAGEVHWIDHHKSAIEKYDDSELDCDLISGLRSVDASGCELTWLYLKTGIEGHNIDVNRYSADFGSCPKFVRLLGDRDTWTFAYGDDSRAAHEAFILYGMPHPKEEWWENIFYDDDVIDCIMEEGQTARRAIMSVYGKCQKWAFEAEFEGHRILVCNSNHFTSELFGERVNDYPFVAVYCYDGSKYKISLYSVNMDVLDFAVKYGGGGHPRACGFTVEDLLFKKQVDK